MNRDLSEIIKSQQKMIGKNTDVLPIKLFEAYQKQLKQVEIWKNKEPSVEIIYLDYKDVLNQTEQVIEKVSSFVGLKLNTAEMMECVDKSLYRNKV
jgi:hypothetical protein